MARVDRHRRANAAARRCEATDEKQRARIWSGRKAAFAAMGRLAPDMICMDGTIPRHALPQVLEEMAELSEQYGLGFCNVFHAGDGNLHPLIIFDVMKPGEFERAEAFGADILRLCVKVGGVLSGEHGVGVEKRDLMTDMFTDDDLAQQGRVKCAFDGAGPVQSRQGVSHLVGLCRAGPYACAWRPAAASPSAALLMEQGRQRSPGGGVRARGARSARRRSRSWPAAPAAQVGKPLDDLPRAGCLRPVRHRQI